MSTEADIAAAIDALIDEYRVRCLWSLRADYYPSTTAERLRVLELIQRHGDLAAYRRAATLRQWLSQSPSSTPGPSGCIPSGSAARAG
jgi:hypothetical protein